MANRRFKVKVTVEADFEIVVDDEIFNEKLSDGITKYECKHGHIQQLRRKQNINEVL